MPIDYEADYHNRARVPEHDWLGRGWLVLGVRASVLVPGFAGRLREQLALRTGS